MHIVHGGCSDGRKVVECSRTTVGVKAGEYQEGQQIIFRPASAFVQTQTDTATAARTVSKKTGRPLGHGLIARSKSPSLLCETCAI